MSASISTLFSLSWLDFHIVSTLFFSACGGYVFKLACCGLLGVGEPPDLALCEGSLVAYKRGEGRAPKWPLLSVHTTQNILTSFPLPDLVLPRSPKSAWEYLDLKWTIVLLCYWTMKCLNSHKNWKKKERRLKKQHRNISTKYTLYKNRIYTV